MTDLGFTGGGKGAGMVYVAGKPGPQARQRAAWSTTSSSWSRARAAEIDAEMTQAAE